VRFYLAGFTDKKPAVALRARASYDRLVVARAQGAQQLHHRSARELDDRARASAGRRTANVSGIEARKLRIFTRRDIPRIPHLRALPREQREALVAAATVLPFRVNEYVLDELIDWSAVPDDPMFQLTFPQPEMLDPEDLDVLVDLVRRGAPAAELRAEAHTIQTRMNPHPGGQMDLNVPTLDSAPLEGVQHKYRETVLYFPVAGQACHTYCTYCFRWAQFVGIEELCLKSRHPEQLIAYLQRHPEVSDLLITGGDPLVISSRKLRALVEPLLRIPSLSSIRLGTKSLAWWPHRYLNDPDADDLLRLFDDVRRAGKQLAFMAHSSHPRELSTPAAEAAVRRVQDTGAVIRTQTPVVKHVNDAPAVWTELWQRQLQLGIVPYYMFVEQNTGPKSYFEVPLSRALQIYQRAIRRVSGLGRTVRGPVMSAFPGKVHVDGVVEIDGEPVFVLKMLQGRDSSWAGRVFFAEYDSRATWLDDLRPAFGDSEFFFEPTIRELRTRSRAVRQDALTAT
jgi:KamA family protein